MKNKTLSPIRRTILTAIHENGPMAMEDLCVHVWDRHRHSVRWIGSIKMAEQQLEFEFDLTPQKRLELLTPDEIFDLADQSMLESLKEDKRLERKQAGFLGSSLSEYLSMWANTAPDGGLMVMGMNDDGTFSGCSSLSQEKLGDLESCQDTCPDARCTTRRIAVEKKDGTKDFIVLIRVYYCKNRAVKTPQGIVYARRGDKKKKLRTEEARELGLFYGHSGLTDKNKQLVSLDRRGSSQTVWVSLTDAGKEMALSFSGQS